MHKLRDASSDSEEILRAELESRAGPGRIYVLGLGNVDRADDGAGVLIANDLKSHFPGSSFSEHDGIEGKVLDISESKDKCTVFFVDAAELGEKPGAIRVVDGAQIKETEITTHRVAVALMSSLLEKAGKKVAVIAIQPGSIEFRGSLTPQVKKTMKLVARALSELISSREQ